MGIDFSRDKPIYQQLIDRIVGDIIGGTLSPGEKLPSVRDYAVQVGVNANTVQRVFKELEQMNVTETKRGQGSFVTTNQDTIAILRNQMKEELTASFLQNIEAFGFTPEEMIQHLKEKEEGK